MSAPVFEDVVSNLSNVAINSLKTNLGKGWDSLTDQERTDCEDLLRSIARARAHELAGRDVKGHLPILEAAFLQWKAIASQEVVSAVKAVIKEIVSVGGQIIGTVLVSFVKGLI